MRSSVFEKQTGGLERPQSAQGWRCHIPRTTLPHFGGLPSRCKLLWDTACPAGALSRAERKQSSDFLVFNSTD